MVPAGVEPDFPMNADKPLHLAIIPDGNRRWAKKRMLQPWKGHEEAIHTIENILEWCRQREDIAVLTLWLFSTENWKRDSVEIEKLMHMLLEYLQKERASFTEKQTRFVHSGRKDRIPKELATLIADIEAETAAFSRYTLHLALDYGGKDELLRALGKLQSDAPTDEEVRAALDHPELPDIDIIVRTSGEHRTSNFFLWQSTYAEWFFVPQFFPDLTTEDLEGILSEFHKRGRRFGG
jgi:undecaprenyl diphosphate synthase